MKIATILCFIASICYACKEKSDSYTNLTIIHGYDEKVMMNGHGIEVDSFHIIPLETNSESVLSGINKIAFIDSLMIIHSYDRVLCFNHSGKFLYSIGLKGRGAGEYLRINTFFIDRTLQTINLVDEFSSKILTYKLNGTYLNEKTYPPKTFYMLHTGFLTDKHKLLCNHYIYNHFNNIYSSIDLSTGDITVLHKFPLQTQNTAMFIGREPIVTYNDTSKMILPFDNKLYTYTDSCLSPVSLIKTQKKFLSKRRLKAEKDFSVMTYFHAEEKGYFTGFKTICETESHLLLNEAGSNRYFLTDKKKNAGQRYTYHIDGTLTDLPLLGIFTTYQNYFVGSISNYSLKELVSQIPENISNQYLQKLKKIAISIEESDNPCLLFYKLKNQTNHL